MVKAMAVRKLDATKRLLKSFRLLGDAQLEYPHLRPSEYMTPGTYPAPRLMPKLYALVLHPGKAWYDADPWNRPEDVALDAAGLLARRHGAWLDWAAGYRASGAVWLFVKPWAYDRETGKRVWFRPTPEDLAALRALCPKPEKAARSKKVTIVRIRGR